MDLIRRTDLERLVLQGAGPSVSLPRRDPVRRPAADRRRRRERQPVAQRGPGAARRARAGRSDHAPQGRHRVRAARGSSAGGWERRGGVSVLGAGLPGSDRLSLKGCEAGVIHRVLVADDGDVRLHRVRAGDRDGRVGYSPFAWGLLGSACCSDPSRCCWRWSRSGTSVPGGRGWWPAATRVVGRSTSWSASTGRPRAQPPPPPPSSCWAAGWGGSPSWR